MKSKFINDFVSDLKNMFKALHRLIFSPEQFFTQMLDKQPTKEQFLKDLFYPILGVSGLIAFLMSWIRSGMLDGVRNALIVVFPLFATLFLANYLFRFFSQKLLRRELDKDSSFLLIGYCLLVIMLVGITTTILPVLFFLNIFSLYVFYLLYVAYRVLFNIDIDNQFWFLLLTGFSVLASPWIVGLTVKMLSGM